MEKRITYSNDDITVIWRPDVCTHSGRCVFGLPEVFDVKKRPWINMLGASTEQIKKQVENCPSGALSWVPNSPESE